MEEMIVEAKTEQREMKEKKQKKQDSLWKIKVGSKLKGIALVIVSVLLILSLSANFFGKSENKVTGKLIGNSLSEISELATLAYDYTWVDEFSDSLKFIEIDVPFTKKYFIGAFDGTIKYGVDLRQIKEPVIHDKEKVITIEMPEIIQLSHEIDYDSLRYYDEKNNIFNPIKVEDGDKFKQVNMENAENAAINRGIIHEVRDYTTNVIESFIHSLYPDYAEYDVICTFPEQTEIKKGTISGVNI